ncbi:MAG: 2OG-Fe(II) oxygenase [Bryobacteraceae bacterium]|nr:2OG-Fe(II) oxygenase [Bryobacteraceae bacterium]
MQRYRFGRGEYQYFSYPLPPLVADLREHLFPYLAPIANDWMAKLGSTERFPSTLAPLTERCHAAGQTRPTPLLLKYGPGDFNCLHQDLYGEVVFPFQAVFLLSEPDRDFTGGELVLVEQQPRAQSIAHVVRPRLGEAVILATRYRPASGSRGHYRTNLKHGVSTIHSGARYTLGVIFHDAQ